MNDQDQRNQALDTQHSYIVQAPAGSGKTELLTQRYLKLLSESQFPENVMAMTFTKKAVSELKARVVESLHSAQGDIPEQSHKKITYELAKKVLIQSERNNWQILNMPQRLKITTIDGLSNLITSRYPQKDQPVPKQIIAQNWKAQNYYLEAAKQTLLSIDDDDYQKSIQSVLLYLNNDVGKFCRLITLMLSKRDQWLGRLYQHNALNLDSLKDSANKIITQYLSLLNHEAQKHLDKQLFELLSFSTLPILTNINSKLNNKLDSLEYWLALHNLCFTTGGQWRKSLNKNNGFPAELKQQKQEIIKIFNTLSSKKEFSDLLLDVVNLPDVDFSKDQALALSDIAVVLKLSVAQLQLVFEQTQSTDFIQVALDADSALEQSSVSDIALFLDYKIQHLLVDEFQDTSATQFALLEKLMANWQTGDGKTLFLVGDPMQSIYLFRQSQVGLFLQVREQGIANIKPKPLQLSKNFRSSVSVVKANNKIFAKIFPNQEDIYKGAISYSPSYENANVGNDKAVHFYPLAHKRDDLEAQQVLNIVKQHETEDVVILVRNRSHLSIITPVLKQAGIEVEAVKSSALKQDLFTRDLLSLTRALLHLGDKLAWLSLLRSPWCGLLLEDLLIIAQRDDKIIYEIIQDSDVLDLLTTDAQNRLLHFVGAISQAIDNISRFSFVQVFEFALSQICPNDGLSAKNTMIKSQFLQIIHECESQDDLNIDIINQRLDELYAPSVSSNVKIMTIHQAKGLEFEHVIIPGLGKSSINNKPPIIQLQEFADQSLLIAPIKSYLQPHQSDTYRYLTYIQSQQEKYESMRLLYVAMTRAKSQIHLLGTLNKSNKANANTFLDLLSVEFSDQFEKVSPEHKVFEDQAQTAPKLIRYEVMPNYQRLQDGSGESVNINQAIDLQYKSLLGSLLHHYYEFEEFVVNKPAIKQRLLESGFSDQGATTQTELIVTLLSNTASDSQFEWIFRQRESTQVEAEFIHNGRSIIIDRFFIDNDVLWIIDFKTADKNDNETIKQFVKRQQLEHAKQLLFYKQVLANIYSNQVKCALYCPSVQKMIEIN